jgi:hypothetical protein
MPSLQGLIMNQTDAVIAFAVWCVVGALLIFVRDSRTKLSYTIIENAGYKKSAELLGFLSIVLWPIAMFIAMVFSYYVLQHMKRND